MHTPYNVAVRAQHRAHGGTHNPALRHAQPGKLRAHKRRAKEGTPTSTNALRALQPSKHDVCVAAAPRSAPSAARRAPTRGELAVGAQRSRGFPGPVPGEVCAAAG